VLAALASFASPATAAQQCHVTFRADGTELLGALELHVDYSAAGGTFNGTGDGVKCTGLAPASTQAARDDDADTELDLGLISGPGFFLPQDVWRCDFTASDAAPVAGEFAFTVDEALTPEGEPMGVDASVSDISCDPGAICGNGVIEAAEECDDAGATEACDGNCQLTYNSQRCAVTFAANGTGSLGGVQFGVDYSDAFGRFQGTGINVDCSDTLPSSYTVMDDVDESQQLNLALISPGGVALPTDLWTCTFVTSAHALVKSNFHFVEIAATDVEAKATNVTLSSTVAGCVYGPFCGDGNKDAGEACDDGNTNAGDCCSPGCTFESSSTTCTDDSNACTNDKCNGSGACTHSANSAPCNDSIFCNGTDTCSGGTCSLHAGSPCPGADGDIDCSETCNESSDNCTGNDPNGSTCNDGSGATSPDTCQNGTCVGGTGPICGDANENGQIQTSDALRALQKSVGQPVSCPNYVCDVNNSGSVLSSDAQLILRRAVGQNVNLNCPPQP
jgi:cysteine-rich repeat protein